MTDLVDRFLDVGDRTLAAGAQGGELLFDRVRVVRDLRGEVTELAAEHIPQPPDDAEREFAYEGNADKVLQTAQSRGWTVVSMKSDFNTVFTFQKK